MVNEQGDGQAVPEILANVRTTPGIITQRGCTYAGCKGVVLGPTRDIVNITHGPIGCGFYSWLTRRNQTRPPTAEDDNFMTYCFSTDMQEEEIIFGGEKKLRAAIQEAFDLFHPKSIGIFSTCPVGLIGDDVHAVAREMKEKLGINVFGFSCEGYKGVSQSAGHHIANNQLFKHVIGRNDTVGPGQFRLGMLGEYNIGGDAFVLEDLLAALRHHAGGHLQRQLHHRPVRERPHRRPERGHVPPLDQLRGRHDREEVRHSLVQGEFHRGGGHGQGPPQDRPLFRRRGADPPDRRGRRRGNGRGAQVPRRRSGPRCQGKTAMLFVGGSRAHHYQELFAEIGMKTVAAGYEFAHRDDYEGRRVLPTIKVDADSRNIEELRRRRPTPRNSARAPARKACAAWRAKAFRSRTTRA